MHTVLLVDDEQWIVESIKAKGNWEKHWFQIIGERNDGEDAFQFIMSHRPDLVFTDIRMPGMSGLELMEKVRERGCNTEFIVVSGYSDFSYAKQAMHLGAADYLLKAVEEEELEAILVRLRAKLDAAKEMNRLRLKSFMVSGGQSGQNGQSGQEDNAEFLEQSSLTDDTNHIRHHTLKQIIDFMDEQFIRDLSLQSIGERFNLHPNYVSQLFQKELGTTFIQWLMTKRLTHACLLLLETDWSIHKISEAIGYQDYFYFAKVFKKKYGLTPSQYRRNES